MQAKKSVGILGLEVLIEEINYPTCTSREVYISFECVCGESRTELLGEN